MTILKNDIFYLWVKIVLTNFTRRLFLSASHLLKFCDFYCHVYGIKTQLWYIKDREGREVDFLVTWREAPWFMVECKLKKGASQPLNYFGNRLAVKQKYLVTMDNSHHFIDKKTGVHIIPASKFLMALV
jgi:uncharacterized protein